MIQLKTYIVAAVRRSEELINMKTLDDEFFKSVAKKTTNFDDLIQFIYFLCI